MLHGRLTTERREWEPVDVVPCGVNQTDESFRAGTFNYPSNPFVILFTCTGCSNEIDAINLKKR